MDHGLGFMLGRLPSRRSILVSIRVGPHQSQHRIEGLHPPIPSGLSSANFHACGADFSWPATLPSVALSFFGHTIGIRTASTALIAWSQASDESGCLEDQLWEDKLRRICNRP
jgi:hypothetical protein